MIPPHMIEVYIPEEDAQSILDEIETEEAIRIFNTHKEVSHG